MDGRIITYLINPLFWATVVTALTVNYLQSQGVGPQWLRSYGMNFLALPIYFYCASALLKLLTRDAYRSISFTDRILTWILVSVLFEALLPLHSSLYVADPLDVVIYATGGIVLYPLLHRAQLFTAFKRLSLKD